MMEASHHHHHHQFIIIIHHHHLPIASRYLAISHQLTGVFTHG